MKTYPLSVLLAMVCAILLFFACEEDNEIPQEPSIGYLSLKLDLNIENLTARSQAVNTDDWSVVIYDAGDVEIYSFENYSEMPDEVELEEGDYYVLVSSEDESVAFDNPFYTGTSEIFTIVKGDIVEVSVTAELANVKVSVQYSNAIQEDFTSWQTTVTSTSGTLVFNQGETRSGYFPAGEALEMSADLTFTKSDQSTETRNVSGTITETQGKDHYIITVDYTLENGVLSPLNILVDESTNDIPVDLSPSALSTFVKFYGGSSSDGINDLKVTDDGGFIAVGHSSSTDGDLTSNQGSTDFWALKLDQNGEIQWSRSYGGSSSDNARAVAIAPSGGYIIVGQSTSNDGDVTGNHGQSDFWVVKIDDQGNLEWQKSLGGSSSDVAHAVSPSSDGGYLVAGEALSSDGDVVGHGGNYDMWTVKLDASGNIVWQMPIGGLNTDRAYSIQEATDGNIIVAGYAYTPEDPSNYHSGGDAYILKIEADGSGILWQQTHGGSSADYANDIILTSDGGYIFGGWSASSDGDLSVNQGNRDYWAVKMDNLGAIEWQLSMGGSSPEEIVSIIELSNGSYAFTGHTSSTNGDVPGNNGINDFWTGVVDASGNLLWHHHVGGSGSDFPKAIRETNDGQIIVAGFTYSYDGDAAGNNGGGSVQGWLIKMNTDGTF